MHLVAGRSQGTTRFCGAPSRQSFSVVLGPRNALELQPVQCFALKPAIRFRTVGSVLVVGCEATVTELGD